jgi:hypothetical protein
MARSTRPTFALDAGALAADLRTVDRLARLQLGVRRRGERLVLRAPSDDLRRLIDLAGLTEALRVEPARQSEEREEPLCVEEERQFDDPPA